MRPATDLASFVAGFVAAEATFVASGQPRSFTFAVGLGARDEGSCQLLASFFGCGHLVHHARRRPHYDDEVAFKVRALQDLVEVIVPFMDEHLPPSHKRRQYLAWRRELLHYWAHDAKRVRTCTNEGCGRPRRAKGLCRRHYYEAFGR